MTNGKFGGHGIEVLPHDAGTYLVQSRTHREDFYMVDLGENSCTCQGWQFRHSSDPSFECWHLRYIKKLLGIKTPQATTDNNQLKAA